ncbi:trimethylamine methyltransferase family protein [Ruegeria sp.]|uniref:trimethylamine methyltransferase family protein n=1 Tax=Ruegeria sp. TaxID=1879320 RepID=UPI0023142B69|nr:trimethylamine methyltransferase family protein [Ruegeria sp.]MDA7964422.1 trimethylamine methyltransferase family protein [Ruegeria sp.]
MTRRAKKRQGRTGTPGPDIAREFHVGGDLRPLSDSDITRIVAHAFDILGTVGMAGLPDGAMRRALAAGATRRADGRLCFPKDMILRALARAPGHVALPGFTPDRDLRVGGGTVHIGTGGAAVQVLDAATSTYRDSYLNDLYDLMRVLEASPNIHYGLRPVIARDLSDPFELDVNSAFACMKATSKPIGISFCEADHIDPIVQMFDTALGHPDAFRERPFCMAVIVHVVPPLTYAAEGIQMLEKAAAAGMVPQICSAGQAGATSPVTLAGALAQGLAECLAGLAVVDGIQQGAPCIYALMPFISDLRTGAMSGGGGEAAIANAAAAQLLAHVGLPSTVSAGMTDSKLADAQAGYEKGYTVALAAHAGADMINLSVGMLGSIMVASPEAMVIDDDMCGAILRSIRGIEVSEATLDLTAVERVVTQDGHYLGEAETLNRMKTDYTYPALADRQSVDDWLEAGAQSIWDRAQSRVAEILAEPPPTHLSAEAEARIRAQFPIRLEP